jgi:hypothetical protein
MGPTVVTVGLNLTEIQSVALPHPQNSRDLATNYMTLSIYI